MMPSPMSFVQPVTEIKRESFLRIVIIALFSFSSLLFSQSNEDCMMCHSDPDLSKMVQDTIEISMFVDEKIYDNSIHGGFECIDCHMDIEDLPHEEPVLPVNCANCHEDAQEIFDESVHGIATSQDLDFAASCVDCHGKLDILSLDESESKSNRLNLAKTCGTCHSKPEISQLLGKRNSNPSSDYMESVHGQRLSDDPEADVATCMDCHGSHAIYPTIDSRSSTNKFNIPKTCGQCHEKDMSHYFSSIHWKSLKRGRYESPVCNDCHGEHDIRSVHDAEAATNPVLQSTRLCASCHSSPTMMAKFGLDHRRLDSYTKSYHGLAVLSGSPKAATCTGCHETHAIKSKYDSTASVHSNHLVETCGKCHEDITQEFAEINVHPVDQQSRNPVAWFFKVVYTWLIVLVIGGMFFHNLVIVVHHIREKRKAEEGQVKHRRFQPFEIYQHLLLFLSFSLLAVTGFALKFPDAGWVKLLGYIGMNENIRGLIHRISAVVMILSSFVQLYYFLFTKTGRKDFKALLPNWYDLLQFKDNMLYYLGISHKHARFGRYDYGEKAEYLALIWGTAIMAGTGLILWFPELFFTFLPSWMFETAEIIHYYEAWLATLAIVVWHFFFVIYHPQKYPMNMTWLDGKITETEFKEHHPLEYEEYLRLKTKEENSQIGHKEQEV